MWLLTLPPSWNQLKALWSSQMLQANSESSIVIMLQLQVCKQRWVYPCSIHFAESIFQQLKTSGSSQLLAKSFGSMSSWNCNSIQPAMQHNGSCELHRCNSFQLLESESAGYGWPLLWEILHQLWNLWKPYWKNNTNKTYLIHSYPIQWCPYGHVNCW